MAFIGVEKRRIITYSYLLSMLFILGVVINTLLKRFPVLF